MKLEAKEITKKFGQQTALDHVDLTIENGEFFGLLGTNGAGKTTMIRILSTLMLPSSGKVYADGQELKRSHVEMKKKITVMTQEYTLRNDMSIEEILEYQGRLYRVPKQERQTRAVELMKLTGLYDHRKKLIRHLSGGMKRKVMLCRALLPKPEIILLDEPTVGLDPIAEAEIYSKFNDISGDKTAIYISHRLSSCKFCDEIAVFHKGHLVQLGSHEQLVAEKNGKYHELWHAQAQYYTEQSA